MSEKCVESVYSSGMYRSFPCGKPAKVQRKGKWYCGRHDPERADILARKKKAQEKYDARNERWHRERDCVNALAGVRDPEAFILACREAIGLLGEEHTGEDLREALKKMLFLSVNVVEQPEQK